MMLNVEKSKVIDLRKSSPKLVYYMMDVFGYELDIEKTKLKRGLVAIVGYDLKCKEHVDRMAGKANETLGMLKRTFKSRYPKPWKDIYVSLVSPHL